MTSGIMSTSAMASAGQVKKAMPYEIDEAKFLEGHMQRLRNVHSKYGVECPAGWRVTAHRRTSGHTAGVLDALYLSPAGRKFRSIKEVEVTLRPAPAPAAAVDAAGAAAHGGAGAAEGAGGRKRKRTVQNYANLAVAYENGDDDDDELRRALKLSAAEQRQNGKHADKSARQPSRKARKEAAAVNGGDATSARPGAAGAEFGFDPRLNKWVKTLNRVRGQVSRLLQEQHTLQTFAADESRAGSNKKVRQTHESKRALEQIKKSKQIIRECLRACEEADGHPPIPDACFDAAGEIDFNHIQCSACSVPDADDENDILLCDGEFCNRAYHVACLPVPPGFDVEALPEDVGWLCPACDCRADILWLLAEVFDLDYDALLRCRWQEVLVDDDLLQDLAQATGPATILSVDLPSDDEEDDEDFAASESDDEHGGDAENGVARAEGAARRGTLEEGPSRAGVASDSDADGDDDDGEDDDKDSDVDSDSYEDDSDGEMDAAEMLRALEEDGKAPVAAGGGDEAGLVVSGKRRRTAVDYRAMNAEMFGDMECYEGEGVDDGFEPDAGDLPDDD